MKHMHGILYVARMLDTQIDCKTIGRTVGANYFMPSGNRHTQINVNKSEFTRGKILWELQKRTKINAQLSGKI